MQSETFNNPNPATGQSGTLVTTTWFQNVNDEISNVITKSGGTLDSTNHAQLYTTLATTYAPLASPTFTGVPLCPDTNSSSNGRAIVNFESMQNYVSAGSLGYTPVHQGGGTGQGSNSIYIGWATSGGTLKCTVDATDLGSFAFQSWVSSNYLSLTGGNVTGTLTYNGTSVATTNDVNNAETDVKNWTASNYQPVGDYATKTEVTQFYPCGGSTTLTVPSWATRFEYFLTGGGGGGSDCQASGSSLTSTNASGGGGGGGATAIGIIAVSASTSISVTIGGGGAPETKGGDSSIVYNGTTYARAGGGGGAVFSNSALSAGGSGGSASASGGTNVPGGNGSDGQNGSFVFAGNGGGSFWGGGARAGSAGGTSGQAYGAGGGGAYDSTFTGNFYYGGYGASGFLLYRWLP